MQPLPTEAVTEETVRTDATPSATEDHILFIYFKSVWIHASRHIIVNTDGDEETGKSRMQKGHWLTDVCYNRSEL